MRHGGFWRNAFARGCQSRLAEGTQAERLWIDSADAPMPWLREAEKLANSHRVGFASPSTIHQEASMTEDDFSLYGYYTGAQVWAYILQDRRDMAESRVSTNGKPAESTDDDASQQEPA
jgi:hypothetical protein